MVKKMSLIIILAAIIATLAAPTTAAQEPWPWHHVIKDRISCDWAEIPEQELVVGVCYPRLSMDRVVIMIGDDSMSVEVHLIPFRGQEAVISFQNNTPEWVMGNPTGIVYVLAKDAAFKWYLWLPSGQFLYLK